MGFSRQIHFHTPQDIVIARDTRQRREIVVDDILDSIRENGLINPIVVTRDGLRLVAGERRLTAVLRLEFDEIPCRYAEELDPTELQIIELEENIKRAPLEWQDTVRAIATIHSLYLSRDPDWTMTATAKALSTDVPHISRSLRLAEELEKGNAKVQNASGYKPAHNMLVRKDSRASAQALEDLLDAGPQPKPVELKTHETVVNRAGQTIIIPIEPEPVIAEPNILNLSFLDWAPQYRGEKFNFIHCDFPYGVNLFGGEFGGRGTDIEYSDEKDIFFELLDCFCENLDNFASLSSHFVFWFSMKHYDEMMRVFRTKAPSIEWIAHPLIWGKSDNAGIIGDARRHPRHVYELALFGSRGSRQLVGSKGDFYSAPTDRALHPSAKPEPVLKHFFSMTVDEHTRLLDPTCGAGSALRAADVLGASYVLGLDIDENHCQSAQTALNISRKLRAASKGASE